MRGTGGTSGTMFRLMRPCCRAYAHLHSGAEQYTTDTTCDTTAHFTNFQPYLEVEVTPRKQTCVKKPQAQQAATLTTLARRRRPSRAPWSRAWEHGLRDSPAKRDNARGGELGGHHSNYPLKQEDSRTVVGSTVGSFFHLKKACSTKKKKKHLPKIDRQ